MLITLFILFLNNQVTVLVTLNDVIKYTTLFMSYIDYE